VSSDRRASERFGQRRSRRCAVRDLATASPRNSRCSLSLRMGLRDTEDQVGEEEKSPHEVWVRTWRKRRVERKV
jgi:hypothetical protein